MKKNFLWIAAAALVFAACANDENFSELNTQENDSVIGFSSYASPQTKGADNNKDASTLWDLENHHTTFDVWAWKYYNSAWVSTAVYNKGTVSYAPSTWTASPLKFWDKSAEKYIFYAAAPSNASWTLKDNGTTTEFDDDYLIYKDFKLTGININSTNLERSFSGLADVDLMIAQNNLVQRAAYNKATPNDVNEIFDHILSRLNVSVAIKPSGTIATLNSDDDETNNVTVNVTGFTITGSGITNTLKNKGSFNENATLTPDVLENGTTKRWGAFDGSDAFTSNQLTQDGTYNLTGKDISSTALTTTATYIAQYLIIPQAITSEVIDRGTPNTNNVYYTSAEAITYNAALANALNNTDPLTAEQAFAYNTAITPETEKVAGNTLSEDEAASYNAKLEGAVSTSTVKTPGGGVAASNPYFRIDYTLNDEPYYAYYNLANAFGVAADGTLAFNEGWANTLNILIDADIITFDAQVYEWTDANTQPLVEVE